MKRQRRCAVLSGATGFIGGNLARRLGMEGWEVVAVTRKASRTKSAMISSGLVAVVEDPGSTLELRKLVETHRPTHCFHLATHFVAHHKTSDVEQLLESNVVFATKLVEAAVAAGCSTIVNVSSAWQHFEGALYRPVSLYAATKQAFEDILAFYAEGVTAATITLSDTYGPGDPRQKLLSLLIDTMRSQVPLEMSSGQQVIDLVHVDDVVDALIIAATTEPGPGPWAVQSGDTLTVKDLVAYLSRLADRPCPTVFGARPDRPREMRTPWNLGPRLPGWSPKVDLARGLRQTLSEAGLL